MAERAVIVTDIGYGDAGKGTAVDYLVRQAESAVVIRHNGGPQAAHNVVDRGGRHHTFSQFGSGSFVPGVKTYLSQYMLVNPANMLAELRHLHSLGITDALERTSISADAIIITPWHWEANQLRERARENDRHGSCGQGVGEARADDISRPDLTVRVRDIRHPTALHKKLERLRSYKLQQLRQDLQGARGVSEFWRWRAFTDPLLSDRLVNEYRRWLEKIKVVDYDHLEELAASHELLVLEGAQGVLLDEWRGFHPYTTWSDTTHRNAHQILAEIDFNGDVCRLGVLRSYTVRHGAGPFVTEDAALNQPLKEYYNGTDPWQGSFRYGHLDLVAHRYAIAACGGVDELMVTGLDRLAALPTWSVCDSYRLHRPLHGAGQFFSFASAEVIRDIRLGPFQDLGYQTRLTKLLESCSPIYQTINSPGARREEHLYGYLQAMQGRLGSPITIASFGPTAADKRTVSFT